MNVIEIRKSVVDLIRDHARREAPNECCGLLLGTKSLIEQVRPARNVRASPNRYLIDPADHFSAIREARTVGCQIIGAYHSHPNSAPSPSPTDLREATYRNYVYVIVSPGLANEVAGYRLVEMEFVAIKLVIVN